MFICLSNCIKCVHVYAVILLSFILHLLNKYLNHLQLTFLFFPKCHPLILLKSDFNINLFDGNNFHLNTKTSVYNISYKIINKIFSASFCALRYFHTGSFNLNISIFWYTGQINVLWFYDVLCNGDHQYSLCLCDFLNKENGIILSLLKKIIASVYELHCRRFICIIV